MQVEYISMQDRFKLMLPCASRNQSINTSPLCTSLRSPRPSPAQQPSAKRIGGGGGSYRPTANGGPTPMQLLDTDLTSVSQLVGRAATGLPLARGAPLVRLAPGGPSSVPQLAGEAAVVPLHSKCMSSSAWAAAAASFRCVAVQVAAGCGCASVHEQQQQVAVHVLQSMSSSSSSKL
ncbi:hypothetical protein QJQ45_030324 [Haematococcus lacustris]|nr:hypothetical protein QJQ45_030324 [Haematococcus lacustris]